jgi:hypothetical protein
MIASVPFQILSEHVPNTNLKQYRYANPFGAILSYLGQHG